MERMGTARSRSRSTTTATCSRSWMPRWTMHLMASIELQHRAARRDAGGRPSSTPVGVWIEHRPHAIRPTCAQPLAGCHPGGRADHAVGHGTAVPCRFLSPWRARRVVQPGPLSNVHREYLRWGRVRWRLSRARPTCSVLVGSRRGIASDGTVALLAIFHLTQRGRTAKRKVVPTLLSRALVHIGTWDRLQRPGENDEGPELNVSGPSSWWRGQDLNLRPSGYEPDELPDCSTPRWSRQRMIRPRTRSDNRPSRAASSTRCGHTAPGTPFTMAGPTG